MSLDPSSGILTLLSASTLHGSSLAAYINSTVSILFRQSIENYLIGPSDPNFLDKLAYVSPPFFSTAPSPTDPWRPLFYFNMTDSSLVVYSSLNFVDGTPYRDVNAALKRYSMLSTCPRSLPPSLPQYSMLSTCPRSLPPSLPQ